MFFEVLGLASFSGNEKKDIVNVTAGTMRHEGRGQQLNSQCLTLWR